MSAAGGTGADQGQKVAYPLADGAGKQAQKVADQDYSRQRGDDFQNEHHRILHQRARIELDEGRANRRRHDLRIEQRRYRHTLAQVGGFHRSLLRA